jgi:hypothetical protein
MTQTPTMTLCRISRRDAEHLMMAPKVAGGWVAVHPDCREAVAYALRGLDNGYGVADILALLPSDWSEASKRRVTTEQLDAIIVTLGYAAEYSVVGEEDVATVWLERLRALEVR